ncbi:MAG: ROK family protein [Ignavibacteriales bacterium]|nr:ROK family protein [Ignavibacteriales bacterium]
MRSSDSPIVIGVDLGGTSVKAGLVSPSGEILYQNKFPSYAEKNPNEVIRQIQVSVQDALKHANGAKVVGVGIGAPGVVDDQGVVKAPPNFVDWDEVPLKGELTKLFSGLPVGIENDANAAAIAESKFGAGKEFPNFLFVIWGTGVGGGIILDHKIFRGPTGGAGEIGHISIDHQGPACNCGSRGCVEAYVGQKYLSVRTAERLKANPESKIWRLVGGDAAKIEPSFISQAAHDGDPIARAILLEAGELLGTALAGVMNVMDLRVSIIGGGLSAAGDFVITAVQDSIVRHVLKPLRKEIRVLPAQLGNNAGILGAAGLVL